MTVQIMTEGSTPRFVWDMDAATNVNKHAAVLIQRCFTQDGDTLDDVFNGVEWRTEDVRIASGEHVVFEQDGVEVPEFWSSTAATIVANKYFRGHVGTDEREYSVRQLVSRVVFSISAAARAQKLLQSNEEQYTFEAELGHMLVHQKYAFNSPVWFNVGVSPRPQSSACFINSVEDTMESIMDLARIEARLFKGGSGSGVNLSSLRADGEKLSGTGYASGPLSFMKGLDAFAGVIKSGGKTRRAAKMVILNTDHADAEAFAWCKVDEERKAHALIRAGYPADFNGPAYSSIFYQNANHSLRASNAFMETAIADKDSRDGRLLSRIGEATWHCGDPGMQFDDTINEWNPCLDIERINASNPCSEYMFLDNSACNLGSLNLVKFETPEGFDIEKFEHGCRVAILAQETLVDYSSYPTQSIGQNSHDFRPLGLGYANLGAMLMRRGIAYGSSEGQLIGGAVTALMTGTAYAMSCDIAQVVGAFSRLDECRESFTRVLNKHYDHAKMLALQMPNALGEAAEAAWQYVVETFPSSGIRNAQATVLAPTGTIAFMMDCDTTGIEPELALIRYKSLAGGGTMQLVNHSVPVALRAMGVSEAKSKELEDLLLAEGAEAFRAAVKAEGLDDTVFQTSFGADALPYQAHLGMMRAAQPFLSGAISKTVNVPSDITAEGIRDIYAEAWRVGIKAVAVYRDGSKGHQVLSTEEQSEDVPALLELAERVAGPKPEEATPEAHIEEALAWAAAQRQSLVDHYGPSGWSSTAEELVKAVRAAAVPSPLRKPLPRDRVSLTHKFEISGHEGYIIVGFYADGTPGEVFCNMSKQGSTLNGLMDTIATLASLALQYGIKPEALRAKFANTKFEPAGFTANADKRSTTSVVDYLFDHLARVQCPQAASEPSVGTVSVNSATAVQDLGPPCTECGGMTQRAGACYTCTVCGASTGCG